MGDAMKYAQLENRVAALERVVSGLTAKAIEPPEPKAAPLLPASLVGLLGRFQAAVGPILRTLTDAEDTCFTTMPGHISVKVANLRVLRDISAEVEPWFEQRTEQGAEAGEKAAERALDQALVVIRDLLGAWPKDTPDGPAVRRAYGFQDALEGEAQRVEGVGDE